MLADAQARLERWRAATSLAAAPDATDLLARARAYLADDLDTPKVLAALDGWSADALEYGGHDEDAPALVRTAVDALLGSHSDLRVGSGHEETRRRVGRVVAHVLCHDRQAH